MKKLKHVGFFKELRHGEEIGGSLASLVSKLDNSYKLEIVNYLKSGEILIASPGTTKDVLSEGNEIIGELCILTDGTWVWPSDLFHYVEKYSVGLPEEFVEWMAVQQWKVPDNICIETLEI